MPPISVVICCANVADTLEPACRSAAWADELVIVDSGSADATGQIAQAHADRYVVEPWRGYGPQKAFGAALAAHDWVLILDGDEQITTGLAEEIRSLPEDAFAQADVMYMRRRHYVMGEPVRAWQPDWQSRLIRRDRVDWGDHALHETREPRDPKRVRRLRGHLEHKRHSAAGFGDYFCGRRLDERLLLIARQMHARGQRCRWHDLALRPSAAFLKSYVLKRGCLDGTFGLLIAQKAALSTQLKYAALWAVQHDAANAEETPSP
jgi:glycosyltransferase involved in cell wall biosynthesis